ncbi:hypothetical protein Hte_007823 [Hypoxylon texense]
MEPILTILLAPLLARARQATHFYSAIDDTWWGQNDLVMALINPQFAPQKKLSIQALSRSLDLFCPEIHEGDHIASADILLTGSHESASMELLKLAVYYLSNNMEHTLSRLTSNSTENAVKVLDEFGLVTRESIGWLMNELDETSGALVEKLLRHSLTVDDDNLLQWILGELTDADRFASLRTDGTASRGLGLHRVRLIGSKTLLQFAVSRGSTRCCKILLDAGADPNIRGGGRGDFPLELAVRLNPEFKAMELVELLLSKGAALAPSKGKATAPDLLFMAVDKNHSLLASRQIQGGAKITRKTFFAAAHMKSDSNATKILSLLYDNPNSWSGPKLEFPNIRDMLLPATLTAAISRENVKAMELLLKWGADPDGLDETSQITHIEYVCDLFLPVSKKVDMITLLLEYGGHIDRQQDSNSSTMIRSALERAACRGEIEIVQVLLDAGANVDSYWLPNQTNLVSPLLAASDAKIARLILQYKPSFIGLELKIAARFGDFQLLDLLLEAGAEFRGDELSFAAESRNADLVKWLLQKKAKVTKEVSPLRVALLTRDFETISTELQCTTYNSSCLYEATLLALHEDRYAFVVERLVSIRTPAIRDDVEVAAFVSAIMNRNSRMCQFLSDSKFLPGDWMVNAPCLGSLEFVNRSHDGIFEVHPCLEYETLHILHALARVERECLRLEFDQSPVPQASSMELYRGIRSAANHALTTLIEIGIFASNSDLDTFIIDRCMDESVLTQLIHNCAKIGITSIKEPIDIRLPLITAIEKMPELVKVLLEAGAEANARPRFEHPRFHGMGSRTPLQFAVERGDIDAMRQLLEAGADINAPPGCTKGATCLQIAVISGQIGIVNMLLDRGAELNAQRAHFYGRTAIEGAAENGRLDLTKLLLLHPQMNNESQRHRIQFIRAVKFANIQGHCTIANMLMEHIQWNESDQTIYDDIDIHDEEIVDEMTQEFSTDELRLLGDEYEDYSESDSDSDAESYYEDEDIVQDFGKAQDRIGSNQVASLDTPGANAWPEGSHLLDLSCARSQCLHDVGDNLLEGRAEDSFYMSPAVTAGPELEEMVTEEFHWPSHGQFPTFDYGEISDDIEDTPSESIFVNAGLDVALKEWENSQRPPAA